MIQRNPAENDLEKNTSDWILPGFSLFCRKIKEKDVWKVPVNTDGKNVWQDVKTKVPNTELKAMVEAYKSRTPQARQDVVAESKESVLGQLDQLAKDTAAKVAGDKPKAKTKAKTKGKEESL